MYGEGISKEGELIALGEKYGVITKSGNSYKYKDVALGRGYDATRQFLKENQKIANEILKEIRSHFRVTNERGPTSLISLLVQNFKYAA